MQNKEPVEANVVAMDIARRYGGVSEQLPCPAFLERLDYDVVTKRKPICEMLRKIATCNVVITSMGPIPESADGAAEISLTQDTAMNSTLFESARGAVAEVCYWLVNRDGTERRSPYTAVGLGYEGLKKIAGDRNREVILVTGGDRRRFEPLKAILKAGLASVLVSDTVTARYLVDEL
jgi:DNA-binding transcriptional regulator LsrR (DeoR family)